MTTSPQHHLRSLPHLTPAPEPLRPGPELFRGHPVHRRRQLRVHGQDLVLRPVDATDAARVDALVRRVSLATRYQRFHAGIRRLTSEQLAGIVDVDHHDRETLVVATVGRRPELVAVGQYVALDERTIELGLLVDDRWQGRGLGRVLAGQLLAAAREAGFTAVTATVLADNAAALHLLTSLGPPTVSHVDDGAVRLLVHLEPVEPPVARPPAVAALAR